MKKQISLAAFILAAICIIGASLIRPQNTAHPGDLFSLPDAEKILGEPARLSDSSTATGATAAVFRCSYTSINNDPKSGKTGVVYFLLEDYNDAGAAQKKYISIKTANEDHGIQTLEGLGNEAYFHTDNQNFYFIMVRKGKKVFNMKVNKITSNTSLPEFNVVAKKITDAM
jgi:hypothetical protein